MSRNDDHKPRRKDLAASSLARQGVHGCDGAVDDELHRRGGHVMDYPAPVSWARTVLLGRRGTTVCRPVPKTLRAGTA
jgi:hypothetical protein